MLAQVQFSFLPWQLHWGSYEGDYDISTHHPAEAATLLTTLSVTPTKGDIWARRGTLHSLADLATTATPPGPGGSHGLHVPTTATGGDCSQPALVSKTKAL